MTPINRRGGYHTTYKQPAKKRKLSVQDLANFRKKKVGEALELCNTMGVMVSKDFINNLSNDRITSMVAFVTQAYMQGQADYKTNLKKSWKGKAK